MKIVSDTFKKDLEFYGKQITSQIFIGSDFIEKKNINKINRYFEGDILKSVMRQCDIELDGIYNYEIGTKIDQVNFGVKGTAEEYEYISWNEWIIDKIEHSEDEQTTKLYCYDKMLYSMINYDLEVEYPITLGNYLEKICERLGLPLYSKSFVNSDIEIEEEKYLGLGYTYRDVLTEIAQASAGTIAINDLGMLEVMYPNSTGEQIKGDKEGNTSKLTIGKKIGPINSIVIARTPQEDNIYIKDDESIVENGLFEIKIENNQIMDSHREDFKEGIFNKLNGLTYYTYELESYGICYLDLMDMFELKGKDDNYYPALMLNNNIEITQDLWETSNCEEPIITETDYSTASESDKTMLRTILRVNKQEGKITQLVEETNQNAYKIAQVTQTVEELNSKIGDIADITTSAEDTDAQVEINEVNQSEPIRLVVRPIGENISYLYPSDNLYPSDDLFMKIRTIRFHNKTTNEDFDYELPDDLLYYDSENYDEFILDYDGQSCVINKRVGYNADGTTYILDNPKTVEYEYPKIVLSEGDYTVSILSYENGYIFARLMAKNIYTTQFYTKAEVNSEISQTAKTINASVDEKLYLVNGDIKQLSADLDVQSDKIEAKLDSNDFTSAAVISLINNRDGTSTAKINATNINLTGYITATDLKTSGSTTINGSNITTGTIDASKVTVKNLNADNITSGTLKSVTIDVGTDAKVGNNLYIGQNQASNANLIKYLYFSENAYIRRWIFSSSGKNYLSIHSDLNTRLECGSGNINVMDGIIQMSHTPTISSDKRLKQDIKDIDVSWIDNLKIKEYEYKNTPDKKQIGLIAQDYIDKDYSKYFLNQNNNDENSFYSIAYGNITNALIQYCQELKKEIMSLKRKMEEQLNVN